MLLLRQDERVNREHQTPIGVLHHLVVRWGDAETATARRALKRWFNGVAFVDVQAQTFAEFWRANNKTAVAGEGPLWVVLGDSTAQGVGASSPLHGYVGQVMSALAARSSRPWRVLNLSRSGAQTWQVIDQQLPVLEELGLKPDLVTCGIGSNDIFATPPKRLRSTLRQLVDRLPRSSVMLDLPLPDGLWTIGSLCSPYVASINRTIHSAAANRGFPVAELSRHFSRPWRGQFAPDLFHPNDLGYHHQARAVLAALPPAILQPQ
ncbi:SGNH/GDSL hydrolase family protein [Kribbella qitaiheensis]|uniref:SGNH/GDSL hydrolase family protein n=1 Tax=Kribbella qitaiheensis TaxID=1544730 RepID=UPI003605C65D